MFKKLTKDELKQIEELTQGKITFACEDNLVKEMLLKLGDKRIVSISVEGSEYYGLKAIEREIPKGYYVQFKIMVADSEGTI